MGHQASAYWGRLRSVWAEIAAHPIIASIWKRWRKEYGLAILAIATATIATIHINMPDKAPDFTVFWAAARHAFEPVYDSGFLSPLQPAPPGPRPFAYPPTFLAIILPFGLVSFKSAFVLWVTLSVTLFVACGLRSSRLAWFALYSPTLLFAALIGQTTLLVGGLAVLGLALVGSRPILAGIALGVAGCIKPQLVTLAPLALLFLRDGRAMAWAAATVIALALAATAIFGPHIWSEWIASLAEFRTINDQLGIKRLGVSPVAIIIVPTLVAGVTLMWMAAKVGDRPRLIAATLGGSLLLSPHAAFYESAVLLLPALAMVRFNWRLVPIGYLLLGGATTTATLAATVVGLAVPVGIWIPRSKPVKADLDAEAPPA